MRYQRQRSVSEEKKLRFGSGDRGNTLVVAVGILLLVGILFVWYEDYEVGDGASSYGGEYLSSVGTAKEKGVSALQQATRVLQQTRRAVDSYKGHVDELLHKHHPRALKEHQIDAQPEASSSDDTLDVKYAMVAVVSVETYIDGALAMGESLKAKSPLVKSGECALVCVASKPMITENSVQRLKNAGWTVVEVKSLGKRVPKSHWADSFDKLYIFGLTQFKKVVFMDTDMLALESPDEIFHKVKLPNSSYIGAIGSNPKSKHHKPYFQSGMIVFIPSRKVFHDLMKMFSDESLPKKHGKLNTLNSRDGSLLRDYFGARYVPVSKAYSKHLAPWESWDGIKMVHFRGAFKPWNAPSAALEKTPDELTFGPQHRLWWMYYDRLHKEETRHVKGAWGPDGSPVDPHTHYWMMRETGKSYIRRTEAYDVASRNLTKEGLVVVKGGRGMSCEDVCQEQDGALWCDEEALSFSQLSDCTVLRDVFHCKKCEWAEHREGFAAAEAPCAVKDTCLRNYMADPRMPVSCSDKHDTAARLCPCSTKKVLSAKPIRYTYEHAFHIER